MILYLLKYFFSKKVTTSIKTVPFITSNKSRNSKKIISKTYRRSQNDQETPYYNDRTPRNSSTYHFTIVPISTKIKGVNINLSWLEESE